MEIERNIKMPLAQKNTRGYSAMFKEFVESREETFKIEYDNRNTAFNAQKAMCQTRCRMKIYDVTITRKQNVLYLIRENMEG